MRFHRRCLHFLSIEGSTENSYLPVSARRKAELEGVFKECSFPTVFIFLVVIITLG